MSDLLILVVSVLPIEPYMCICMYVGMFMYIYTFTSAYRPVHQHDCMCLVHFSDEAINYMYMYRPFFLLISHLKTCTCSVIT